MTKFRKTLMLVFLVFMVQYIFGCKEENHIDKHEIRIDYLNTLQDGFFAYRKGNVYYSNEKFMIWYTLDDSGNVKNVFNINDLKEQNSNTIVTISKYNIDTTEHKIMMQRFLDLSGKYKFGHIKIDKSNKISFSYQDGLSEQFVYTFNDSLKKYYLENESFKLLDNAWFEYIGR